jgi:hypothetical protein
MGMICSALAIDASLIERIRQDEELVLGVTGLALKRMRDQHFEWHIKQRPAAEQEAARVRRRRAEIATLERLPQQFATQVAATLALRDRAAELNIGVATSIERSWDALNHVLALGGGSIFEGTPFGPDQGCGPAFLRLPAEVATFSTFLDGPGSKQFDVIDMVWLRQQLPYAWPEPGDTTISDDDLKQDLKRHFESLRAYVADAANRGDSLLIWIS